MPKIIVIGHLFLVIVENVVTCFYWDTVYLSLFFFVNRIYYMLLPFM